MEAEKRQRIVIAGGGTSGWMAAAALAHACKGGMEIQLVESDDIGIIGVGEGTLPPLRFFNHILGIAEDDFMRETQATIKLGVDFVNWSRQGERFFHPFGAFGQPINYLPFHYHWLRQRERGENAPLQAYSVISQMAMEGRFLRPPPLAAGQPYQPVPYAYHFDAGLYVQFLRRYAEQRGVQRMEGRIGQVELRPGDGHIAALRMEDGRRIAGDFFVDSTGFRALLIGQALGVGYEDWSHWLPCDRAVAVPCERTAVTTPYTRSTAQEAGWQWRIPLRHRIGNGYVYCSQHISDADATEKLLQRLDGKPLAEPRPLRFTTGKRQRLWHKNCVAIGLSSGFMEPLESTSIGLIMNGILRLLEFLPGDRCNETAIAQYNREADREFAQNRDFVILHYSGNGRPDQPLWQYVKHMKLPDSLQERIELFRASGKLDVAQEQFAETSWLTMYAAFGLMPGTHHPLADIGREQIGSLLRNLRRDIRRQVAAMPHYEDFLKATFS